MIDYKCIDCLWWDEHHISVKSIPVTVEKSHPGFCRKKRPNVVMYKNHHFGTQPVMDAEEFCGEFKKDEGVT